MGMSHVFHRAHGLPVASGAEGVWIIDETGKRYLDGAGGAVVNGIGHGRPEIAAAMSDQARTLDYVHAHTFTSRAVEEYAEALATVAPLDDVRVFPVSGGSEANETAFKLARSFHIANGEPERTVVLSRRGSYHGNTLGALDASWREGLRRGYEPWLGRFSSVPRAYEYRCENLDHPTGCARWHASSLSDTIEEIGSERVAAFIAEPIGGATLGATVPVDDYWTAMADVCRSHGVLVIADEVMTGFGRTGTWFAIEQFGVRPDIVVCAKGASSGYFPLGLCMASGHVADTADQVFDHGFTYSHHPVGSAVGHAVLDVIRSENLVERSAGVGGRLKAMIEARLGSHPHVGDVRGRGMLLGVEFVSDRDSRAPFPAEMHITERVRHAGLDRGLITYPVSGCADGRNGDGLLLGPPLVITGEECAILVDRLAEAVEAVL
jgi:adenosylmethionine-8-amino-7-oxononanoate aminotransferase